MKQVTLHELHENTGWLVREAVRLGGIVVTDRGTPIARIEPADRQRVAKPFKQRRVLPAYQELLDSGALQGGTDWAAFRETNPLEWADVQARMFPVVVPTRAVWEDVDLIVDVLTLLGEKPNLNHLFLPSGGGLDLHRAARSVREPGCIEFITNGCVSLLKPRRLMFESFLGDPQWNYFRLAADDLEPSGVYEDLDQSVGHEELTDIGRKIYAERLYWDCDEYEGGPLPPHSRPLMRYFRGAFVIFQKTSIYNRNPSTYDARHNNVSADGFREYIHNVITLLAERSTKS